MNKLAKSIQVKDLQEQVPLQFNVKTEGRKEHK